MSVSYKTKRNITRIMLINLKKVVVQRIWDQGGNVVSILERPFSKAAAFETDPAGIKMTGA